MKLQFWSVGKDHEPYVKSGVELFTQRIGHYFPVEWKLIPVPRHTGMLSEADLKKKEAQTLLNLLQPEDYLVVLDEQGKSLTSEGLSDFLQKRTNESVKRLIFLIGGAYGIDASVRHRGQFVWSLSTLTFPHQLVRLILSEQVYRACTLIKNEKYHHR